LVADLVAVGEGVVEVGVTRPVLRDGGFDLAAGEHHGLGRRAERSAQVGRRRAGMMRQWEIAAVAGAHTEYDAGTISRLAARPPALAERIGVRTGLRRQGLGCAPMEGIAEQGLEQAFCRGGLRGAREAKRRCG
jgi:hypothetical protein